jgi:hypothetical protein
MFAYQARPSTAKQPPFTRLLEATEIMLFLAKNAQKQPITGIFIPFTHLH